MRGGRLACGAIVHADIGHAAAVGDIGDQRDDRNTALHSAVDRRGDFRLVKRLEEEAVRSARRDPVDKRGQIGDPRNLAKW